MHTPAVGTPVLSRANSFAAIDMGEQEQRPRQQPSSVHNCCYYIPDFFFTGLAVGGIVTCIYAWEWESDLPTNANAALKANGIWSSIFGAGAEVAWRCGGGWVKRKWADLLEENEVLIQKQTNLVAEFQVQSREQRERIQDLERQITTLDGLTDEFEAQLRAFEEQYGILAQSAHQEVENLGLVNVELGEETKRLGQMLATLSQRFETNKALTEVVIKNSEGLGDLVATMREQNQEWAVERKALMDKEKKLLEKFEALEKRQAELLDELESIAEQMAERDEQAAKDLKTCLLRTKSDLSEGQIPIDV